VQHTNEFAFEKEFRQTTRKRVA